MSEFEIQEELLDDENDVVEMTTEEALEEIDVEALASLSATAQAASDPVDISVLKLLISRLAQILAQEVDMLENMDIGRLGTVQKEKKALVDALEKQKKLIARRGDLLNDMSEDEEDELRELVDVFEAVLRENHKRLLVAKEVNGRVVEAIAELANENAQRSFYTHQGERAGDPSVSVSLNRSI